MEEAAANFVQFKNQLSPGGNVQGVSILPQNVSELNTKVLEDEENMPSTSATLCRGQYNTNCNPRKREHSKDERKEQFQRQNAIYEQALSKISNIISELKTIVKADNVHQQNTLSEVKNF